ncbi:MAG: 5'/3'-nucleotidase SurE [Clostridia bacterium]|nr:5'/3'-nucleotidase SurE [Clostridia bacterium]
MKILISNDDGINSKGLIAIADKLSKNNEVLVVAPDGNRSAISHSLTIGRPIKINKVHISDNFTSYAISGTPADCVKMANILMPDFKADIVVAGINKGHNIGSDILYSGTVAIACEASFFNNISFAFSAYSLGESDFSLYADYVEKIISKLLPISSVGCVWNINFPDVDKKILGVKFAPLGKHLYSDRYVKTLNGEYLLEGEIINNDENSKDCDVELIKMGYITVTPLLFNKTDYNKLSELNSDIFK